MTGPCIGWDWNAIDHAEEVMEYFNIDVSQHSYQDREAMGKRLLGMAAKRFIAQADAPEQTGNGK